MQVDLNAEAALEFIKDQMYKLKSAVEYMKLETPYHTLIEDKRESVRQNTDEALKQMRLIRDILRRIEPELIRRQKEITNEPTDEAKP